VLSISAAAQVRAHARICDLNPERAMAILPGDKKRPIAA
jgi:hypothetical protein